MNSQTDRLRLLALCPPDQPELFQVTEAQFEAACARSSHALPAVDFGVCDTTAPNVGAILAEADVLVGAMVPTEAVRANRGPLKLIQLSSAGYDHLLPLDWLPEGVAMSTASGVHAPKLREWAAMALMMLHCGLPAAVSAQKAHRWAPIHSGGIAGRTALIFGTGGLGTAVAEAAVGLGVKAIGVRRSKTATPPFAEAITRAEAMQRLPEADFVVLATPLSEKTRGMIGREAFAAMKAGAGFINVGRGGLIDQDALIAVLESGHLSGAILDVTTPEPLPAEAPLWDVPNLIVTQHVSCDDPTTYVPRVLDILCENLSRLNRGEPLRNRIDPDA